MTTRREIARGNLRASRRCDYFPRRKVARTSWRAARAALRRQPSPGTVGALWASRLTASHASAAAAQRPISLETGWVCPVSLLVAVVLVGLMSLLRRGKVR